MGESDFKIHLVAVLFFIAYLGNCSVPCDYIPRKSYPLFEASGTQSACSGNQLESSRTMNIQLHKNARTTPAIRRELQAQPDSVTNKELAERYHLSRHTVAKWRKREGTADGSHR